jgi:16S rRNA G966 N2-methylase RsmD
VSIAAHLAAGRAAKQRLIEGAGDSCTITRPGAKTFNQTTGAYAQSTATIYTGVCRVKPWTANDTEAAEAEVDVTRVYVDLPWGSALVQRGDTITVTSSNAWLTGRALAVTAVQQSTTATGQRITAEIAQR